ncbi:MAG TPA: hypothetical protein VK717_10340 [Opitutaceae bacterium]|jgi:hypothetical protein|nr:hypothetical protein [Opitutaceae bacterium]
MSHPCQLVVLTSFSLPKDFAEQSGLASALAVRRLEPDHYKPHRLPRFIGYFFVRAAQPIGLCRYGRVELPLKAPIAFLPAKVTRITQGQFGIAPTGHGPDPAFLLIHDQWDGSCCLQRFDLGCRFLTSAEPILRPGPSY